MNPFCFFDYTHMVYWCILIFMKILALDIGDVWVGSAISDESGIVCRPYITVKYEELLSFLEKTISEESVGTILVGHPITMGGTKSEQTKKVEKVFEDLKEKFSSIDWILRDERFSSQRAADLIGALDSKEKKKKEHSVAAAFILQDYLNGMS